MERATEKHKWVRAGVATLQSTHYPVTSMFPKKIWRLQIDVFAIPPSIELSDDYKLTCLPSLPPLSYQMISIKPAFSCMKIVLNLKEIVLRSAFGCTDYFIFVLKIKILFGLCRTVPAKSERFYIGMFMDIYSI